MSSFIAFPNMKKFWKIWSYEILKVDAKSNGVYDHYE